MLSFTTGADERHRRIGASSLRPSTITHTHKKPPSKRQVGKELSPDLCVAVMAKMGSQPENNTSPVTANLAAIKQSRWSVMRISAGLVETAAPGTINQQETNMRL